MHEIIVGKVILVLRMNEITHSSFTFKHEYCIITRGEMDKKSKFTISTDLFCYLFASRVKSAIIDVLWSNHHEPEYHG